MRIDGQYIEVSWYEDDTGNRYIAGADEDGSEFVPDEVLDDYPTHHTLRPTTLLETVSLKITAKRVSECSHLNGRHNLKDDDGPYQICTECAGIRRIKEGDDTVVWESGHEVSGGVTEREWDPDLVMAMTRPTSTERSVQAKRWKANDPVIRVGLRKDLLYPPTFALEIAIVIAATACERCQNALKWTYAPLGKTNIGYMEKGPEWYNCPSLCQFCVHITSPKHAKVP